MENDTERKKLETRYIHAAIEKFGEEKVMNIKKTKILQSWDNADNDRITEYNIDTITRGFGEMGI